MQFEVKDGKQPHCSEWFRNSQVVHTGKEAYHTMFHAYPSEEEAEKQENLWEYLLDGEWRFFFSNCVTMNVEEMVKETYDDGQWQKISVPSSWQNRKINADVPLYVNTKTPFYKSKSEICPPEVPDQANSMGLYRRYFSVPECFEHRHTMLCMEGVESAVNIWINGYYVGFSQGSFSPVEFEITQYLHGGENLICCQVYRYSAASFLEDQDMWRLAGIFRSVRLISRPDVGIFDFQIHTELDEKYENANLKIMAFIRNRTKTMQDAHYIEACLEAPDGTLVKDAVAKGFTGMENPDWPANSWRGMPAFPKPIFANSIRSIYLNIPVKSPKKWTAETPVLYHVRLTLLTEQGQVIEVIRWPIGFRKIEVMDGKIHINGKHVIIKGVNYHEFSPYNLRSVTKEEMETDIRIMKQNHINAVRCAHYPHSRVFYELCDQYGLYVMDEADLETHDISYKDDVLPGNDMRYTNACLDRISAMVLTNQNYSSIVIWSLGNEMGYGKNVEFMAAYCRTMDGSRLIHKRQMGVVADMDSDTYPSVEWIEKRAINNPKKPFLINEYAHAMGNAMGNFKEYQDCIRRYPALAGGFIWEWCDHGILDKNENGTPIFAYGSDYPADYQDENFCIDGVVLPDRKETAKLAEVKTGYQYIQAELLSADTGLIRIKNEYSYTDLKEFNMEWSLEKNGCVLNHGIYTNLCAAPGEYEDILLDINLDGLTSGGIDQENEEGLYLLNLLFVYKELPMWADPGFVDTRIQLELGEKKHSYRKQNRQLENEVYNEEMSDLLHVVEEETCMTFTSNRVWAVVSKKNGYFESLKYGTNRGWKTVIESNTDFAKGLQVFRAPTDNDRHSPTAIGDHGWLKMGLDQMKHECKECALIEKNKDCAKIKIHHIYRCADWENTGFHHYVVCCIYGDGHIAEEQYVQPFGELGILPRVGIRMPVNETFSQVDYFGLGPKENYPDRLSGTYLGRFSGTVRELEEPYIRPQENGSRGRVSYVALTDKDGEGILVTGERPFAFSALPYSAEQLNRVRHRSELEEEKMTILSIDWKRNGLGNSSCGTDVLEKYRLYPTESHFVMELMPYEKTENPFSCTGCRMENGEVEKYFSIDHTISLHPHQEEKRMPFDPSDLIERMKAGFRQ